MDIEKLIEQANRFGMELRRDGGEFEYSIGEKFLNYATALSTLQAKCKDMDCQLEEFSRFLCNQTGGLLSKTNYSAETMISYAEDYQQRVCNDSCDLRAEFEQLKANYDRYKSHVERLLSLPDCNTCDSKDCCAYCPDIGAFTRINCPLWRGQKGGLT